MYLTPFQMIRQIASGFSGYAEIANRKWSCYNCFMVDLHKSHDKIFRRYFRQPNVARSFVENYLPPEIVTLLDLDSLNIRPDSFIDDTLSDHYSDLLYRIDLRDGRPAYLYLLFDHKSYVDSMVAYQLLDYIKQIWDKSLNEQREAQKEQPEGETTPLWLPPVMPLVVYHGVRDWTVSREFIDLFEDLPAPLRPYTPNFEYWLCDLSDYPPEAIVGEVLLRVVLLLLKYIYHDELEARLPEILGLLRELADKQTVLGHLRTILRYVSGGKAQFTPEELKKAVDKIFEGDTQMQTFFERRLEEAHRKGEQIGLTKGEQIGLTKGRQVGEQIGLTKGLQEGQRQTHIKNIKQILAIRFEIERETYDDSFAQLALPDLEALLPVALLVQEVAEFETALTDRLPPEPNDLDNKTADDPS